MATITKTRDNIYIDEIIDSEGGGPVCNWNESVCVSQPSYFIQHQEDSEPELYCPVHYLLTMRYYLEVGLPLGWAPELHFYRKGRLN